jgi:nicotinamide-nucleotide amidase
VRAEVIAIGDELTSGQRVDTNSAWLSQRLAEIGVSTSFHTTVADDLSACVEAFRLAGQRADVVVITGGLGPTADDLTREALAAAARRPLELREDVLAHIRTLFASRRREMPARNRVQAMFPQSSQVIDNPHGTAPGIDLTLAEVRGISCRYFALPGVPAEMREMWHRSVRPALLDEMGAGQCVIVHRRLKCFGVGESDLEQMLPDLIRRGRSPSVGITVHKATITLRVSAEGAHATACEELIAPTLQVIRDCLGDLVFGEEDDELQHAVCAMLARCGRSLSTLEWGTPGILGRWLSDVDAASFVGGIVVASERAALGMLEQGSSCDSGNPEKLCAQLALATQNRFETDYALVVGPVREPSGGRPPQICLALADRGKTRSVSLDYAGHPDILAERAAKQSLNLLRKTLLNFDGDTA